MFHVVFSVFFVIRAFPSFFVVVVFWHLISSLSYIFDLLVFLLYALFVIRSFALFSLSQFLFLVVFSVFFCHSRVSVVFFLFFCHLLFESYISDFLVFLLYALSPFFTLTIFVIRIVFSLFCHSHVSFVFVLFFVICSLGLLFLLYALFVIRSFALFVIRPFLTSVIRSYAYPLFFSGFLSFARFIRFFCCCFLTSAL